MFNRRETAQASQQSVESLITDAAKGLVALRRLHATLDTPGGPLDLNTPFRSMEEVAEIENLLDFGGVYATGLEKTLTSSEARSKKLLFYIKEIVHSAEAIKLQDEVSERFLAKMWHPNFRKLEIIDLLTENTGRATLTPFLERLIENEAEAALSRPPVLIFMPLGGDEEDLPFRDRAWRGGKDFAFLRVPPIYLLRSNFWRNAQHMATLNSWDEREFETVTSIFDPHSGGSSLEEIVQAASDLDSF